MRRGPSGEIRIGCQVLRVGRRQITCGCRESSFYPLVGAPIHDSALAGQDRQALGNFERRTFIGEKSELAIDRIRLSALAASDVTSFTLQTMGFPFVGQLNVQDVLQPTSQLGIADRK